MNERLEMKVNDLIQEVRRETFNEVIETLWRKTDEIDQLLENGYIILETAYGERFSRLYEKRKLLYEKRRHYIDACTAINEIRFK